jgi:prevent-host-death family protein
MEGGGSMSGTGRRIFPGGKMKDEKIIEVSSTELNASLAEYLARVRAGESFLVAEQGTPVVKLEPLVAAPQLERERWLLDVPRECGVCHDLITDSFVHGTLKTGDWSLVCARCYEQHGAEFSSWPAIIYRREGEEFFSVGEVHETKKGQG